MADEPPPDQILYIQLLQEKNRLLKKIKQKTTKPSEVVEREAGFTTYFAGGNAQRAKVAELQKKPKPASLLPQEANKRTRSSAL